MGQKSAQLNPFSPSLILPSCISVHTLFRFKYLHVQVAVLKCLPYWTLAVLGISHPPLTLILAELCLWGTEIQAVTI